MEALARWIGRLSGVLGVIVCTAAVMSRAAGRYVVADVQTGTWLLAGVALVAIGCFGLLLADDLRIDTKR